MDDGSQIFTNWKWLEITIEPSILNWWALGFQLQFLSFFSNFPQVYRCLYLWRGVRHLPRESTVSTMGWMNLLIITRKNHRNVPFFFRKLCLDLGVSSWWKLTATAVFSGIFGSFFFFWGVLKIATGWCFKYFLFSPLPGEMIQFDEHIFQLGWFNHQPG